MNEHDIASSHQTFFHIRIVGNYLLEDIFQVHNSQLHEKYFKDIEHFT